MDDTITIFKKEVDLAFEYFKEIYMSKRPAKLDDFNIGHIYLMDKPHGDFITVSKFLIHKAQPLDKSTITKMEKYITKRQLELYFVHKI